MRRFSHTIAAAKLLCAIFWCGWSTESAAQANGPRRILALSDSTLAGTTINSIRSTLQKQGWSAPDKLQLDYQLIPYTDGRITDQGYEKLHMLLSQSPHIVITFTTNMAMTVKKLQTANPIPMVMAPVVSPIECGLVSSLLHPEQDITGIDYSLQESRRLYWLTRILPNVRHVWVPYNHNNCAANGIINQLRPVAEKLNISLHTHDVRNTHDYEQAINSLPSFIQAVFLIPDHFLLDHGEEIIQAAKQRLLPLSSPFSEHVTQGALFSYAFRRHELGQETARLVSQILSGTRARNLPIEQSEPVLTINLRSADALSIPIPQAILRQSEIIRSGGG